MLKIRMQRTGRINDPSYRLVVTEHTAAPRAGKFVERVGSYDPKSKERIVNTERVKYWMSVGAKPSDTVHNMLVSLGILNAKKINVLPAYKAPEAPAEEATPAAESTEAPAEPTEAPAAAPETPSTDDAPAGSTNSPQAGENAGEQASA